MSIERTQISLIAAMKHEKGLVVKKNDETLTVFPFNLRIPLLSRAGWGCSVSGADVRKGRDVSSHVIPRESRRFHPTTQKPPPHWKPAIIRQGDTAHSSYTDYHGHWPTGPVFPSQSLATMPAPKPTLPHLQHTIDAPILELIL